ncbi:hypothetical protein AB0C59_18490 [Streptomyces sp. NPDC048664]|uniref:hypothetical protein n=1 Tax=Streptomyces sp. NPDC048664 TaxID=3154505 RepID=UPI00343B38E1
MLSVAVGPLSVVASAVGSAASLPVAAARRVMSVKEGLPLYAGLGALTVIGVLEWPLAVGAGMGYAVLRRGGLLQEPDASR